MEPNKTLTAYEIFVQITQLQRQLTENSQTSLHRLGDAISALRDENDGADFAEQVSEICDVFKTRECTLLKMLDFYRSMYDDIRGAQSRKADLVSRAFERNAAAIEASDMESQDKFAALTDISDKIAQLLETLLAE